MTKKEEGMMKALFALSKQADEMSQYDSKGEPMVSSALRLLSKELFKRCVEITRGYAPRNRKPMKGKYKIEF